MRLPFHPTSLVIWRSIEPRRSCKTISNTPAARAFPTIPSAAACTTRAISGNATTMSWIPTRTWRKNATFVATCAPCYQAVCCWRKMKLTCSCSHACALARLVAAKRLRFDCLASPVRQVVFGAMNLSTGHRLFLAGSRQRARDFPAFLGLIHQH